VRKRCVSFASIMSPEVFHVERSSSFIQVLRNRERIAILSRARCASKRVLLHSFIFGDHKNDRSSCMLVGHRMEPLHMGDCAYED
jgi:hypothetical protein